jgi:hypothetical protein
LNRFSNSGGKAMPEEPQQNKAGLIAIYQQICTSYQGNIDFRAKLLGFLPLATGGGIFLLLNTLTDETKQYMFPVGVFGFAITLGLFSYEIHGILRGNLLIIMRFNHDCFTIFRQNKAIF